MHQKYKHMFYSCQRDDKFVVRLKRNISDDKQTRTKYMNELSDKIQKYLEPVRPNRAFARIKDKKNRHSLTKRKAF